MKEQNSKLNLAICDDEQYVHQEIDSYIKVYEENRNIKCEVVHFYSAEEILKEDINFDILLLDIEMPEMDGIEAAYELNRKVSDCKIIMLTSRVERFKEAFKIGAIRFVTKPIQEDELFEAVDEACNRMNGMKKVRVHSDGIAYQILQKDRSYLEVERDNVRIYTEKMEYRSDIPLKQWEEELDSNMFFKCHRSYIVNLDKIKQFEKNYVELQNGERVPISRRKWTELHQAFLYYDAKRR